MSALLMQAQACLAGDSAAYERRASSLDDVVVVSALRSPMCKVQHSIHTRSAYNQCSHCVQLSLALRAQIKSSNLFGLC